MHVPVCDSQTIVTNFLQKNNNVVFTYCWLVLIGDTYCVCEQYFVVKDFKLYEIQHDQSLVPSELDVDSMHKLKYHDKYSKNKKYIWNNYYFSMDTLRSVAEKSFDVE